MTARRTARLMAAICLVAACAGRPGDPANGTPVEGAGGSGGGPAPDAGPSALDPDAAPALDAGADASGSGDGAAALDALAADPSDPTWGVNPRWQQIRWADAVWTTIPFQGTGAGDFRDTGPYTNHRDSIPNPAIPRGAITERTWQSRIYGDTRSYWVYVPAQYDGKAPAALMVFQDGRAYLDGYLVHRALDNLIAAKHVPVVIGVFVDPGANRSREYDTLSDVYARFLLEEIIPEVRKTHLITDDPEGWAIGGSSSGGICAFTVAWQRPDRFRRVISHIGSFTNIRGGNQYPDLVRAAAAKPLRVFLQDGEMDLVNQYGSWPAANRALAAALAARGYRYQFVFGLEGHNANHGRSIMPDTLRWIWKDYPVR